MALSYSAFLTSAFSSTLVSSELSQKKFGQVTLLRGPSVFHNLNATSRRLSTVRCEAAAAAASIDPVPVPIITPETLKRSDFPTNFIFGSATSAIQCDHYSTSAPDLFIFGSATSAIQIEGNGTEGGRGPSTWDDLIHADEGRKAVDSYNRYKEDVKALKDMGVDAYRFSIAWPRIFPDGTLSSLNQAGVDYYNSLLDELELNRITPVVTLMHFDLPVALQEKYGGFMDRRIIDDFKAYAEFCFETFGQRVKKWITINEGSSFVLYGTKLGVNASDSSDTMSPYVLTHNILLAHATAAKLYKEQYQAVQQGEIGIALVSKWSEPKSDDPADILAAEKSFDRYVGWYMGPLHSGDYPEALKEFVPRLPQFSDADKLLVQGSYDFIGVNYYITTYAKATATTSADFLTGHTRVEGIEESFDKDGVYIGPLADGAYPIFVYPDGLKKLLVHMKEKYNSPKIYISENGVSSRPKITMSVSDANATGMTSAINSEMRDVHRINAIRNHLFAIHEALQENVDINGYFVWTLMDNMEFGEYDVRFGLNYVDYFDNFKRIPKDSALWYGSFLKDESKKQ